MKKCLIVVDYQNDFVTGALGFSEAEGLDSRIAAKIDACRQDGGEIIFTLDTHGENYLETQEGRGLPAPHCMAGTIGHSLFGETARRAEDGDLRFAKDTFGSGELYEYLKGRQYESVELCGVVSNICVLANAVLAKTALPEVPIVVDSKCVASNAPALNRAALEVMRSLQIIILP
jgi:nicotinamidase-related amidase